MAAKLAVRSDTWPRVTLLTIRICSEFRSGYLGIIVSLYVPLSHILSPTLPIYLSLALSLSLCLSLPLFIFLVLYLSFTSPSHLPSSSHHDRSVSVPTSLVTLGLLHSFLHHLSFHIYLLSHKHMNTITATIFQLEVLGTAIANPMPPKPFCL